MDNNDNRQVGIIRNPFFGFVQGEGYGLSFDLFTPLVPANGFKIFLSVDRLQEVFEDADISDMKNYHLLHGRAFILQGREFIEIVRIPQFNAD